MATKYEVLVALVESQTALHGDIGNADVVAGVVEIISRQHGGEEELAESIFDYIADCFTPDPEGARTRVEG